MKPTPIGRRFHWLRTTSEPFRQNGRWVVRCRCKCGTKRNVRLDALSAGITLSCGCWHRLRMKQTHTKHGAYQAKLYHVWQGMIQRCHNPKANRYRDYGGRGITVCQRWRQYPNFQRWATANGYRAGVSVDRRNNNRGYCPSNCRFATRSEQQRNQRVRRTNQTWTSGICWDSTRKQFRAEFRLEGRRISVGRFDDLKTAIRHLNQAKKKAA